MNIISQFKQILEQNFNNFIKNVNFHLKFRFFKKNGNKSDYSII